MATPEEKYELITRGLQEVLGGDSIKAILAEGRQPKCYWGIVVLQFSKLAITDLYIPSLSFFPLTCRNCSNWKTYVKRLKKTTFAASNSKYYRCFI